jgi:hypothetical protein
MIESMLDTLDVWVIYYAGCSWLFCLGLGLRAWGHRGRFSRALVITAFTGMLVLAVAYFTYQPPPPPPEQIDPHPSLSTVVNGLAKAAAEGAGEAVVRLIGPLIDGALSFLAVFLISLLFPRRGRRILPDESATRLV